MNNVSPVMKRMVASNQWTFLSGMDKLEEWKAENCKVRRDFEEAYDAIWASLVFIIYAVFIFGIDTFRSLIKNYWFMPLVPCISTHLMMCSTSSILHLDHTRNPPPNPHKVRIDCIWLCMSLDGSKLERSFHILIHFAIGIANRIGECSHSIYGGTDHSDLATHGLIERSGQLSPRKGCSSFYIFLNISEYNLLKKTSFCWKKISIWA